MQKHLSFSLDNNEKISKYCNQLEIGGKGILSLTYSVVEASLIEASLMIDVYIIHGYFQFLLHM